MYCLLAKSCFVHFRNKLKRELFFNDVALEVSISAHLADQEIAFLSFCFQKQSSKENYVDLKRYNLPFSNKNVYVTEPSEFPTHHFTNKTLIKI